MIIERRSLPFSVDQEKFTTQRCITYLLILIFASVVAEVLWRNVETERSTVLQTVINLTMLAVGYWLGASKQGQDQAQAISEIAKAAPVAAKEAADKAIDALSAVPAVPAVTPAPMTPEGIIPAKEVEQQPKGNP